MYSISCSFVLQGERASRAYQSSHKGNILLKYCNRKLQEKRRVSMKKGSECLRGILLGPLSEFIIVVECKCRIVLRYVWPHVTREPQYRGAQVITEQLHGR